MRTITIAGFLATLMLVAGPRKAQKAAADAS